ncbi:rfaE bifunctional protein, domain II [Mucilaginibacter lappiensis]|uniref:D-glycero-beta-D-manno-heptose 1-phosphate adenylyltransferase n=1 Tax=Mucilaginibacter lappiensis TaxID=354630 RepID=A0ABR6PVU3_9SPHI|nr:D-glycero-beta-D-manno-heptose 1-phosphate adenylyltransferase [Mucilaginibacter lappiensis]MBB6112441.1 rfaE bifunctional protein nucleotidyltransferase chain/domain [Mucilaginibacter lappiensis]SIS00378.1 rfaE bifunctional protein, domain II [Mucilaginibacter lappiensis]
MRIDLEKTLVGKITNISLLKTQVQSWQRLGQKVVFTNGVFDLLHIGHITYLAKAAELGEKLIIGLNADSSVRRLKGENRPVNDQNNRAAILAALFFVDAVVLFDEDTPLNLISTLLPDILVKGADYSVENIVGSKEVLANGGEVKTIDFVKGYSSTAIIEKIRQQIPGKA